MNRPRRLLRTAGLAVLLWIAALVTEGVYFVNASQTAKDATSDVENQYDLVGLPLMTGFREGERFGVHIEWGSMVLLLAPILLGVFLVAVQLGRAQRTQAR